MDNPLVIVRSLVYNHEPYLRQCLDGFVMQKTDFKFEVQIHDDASTDNSAAIILEYAEKYPDIIKPYIEEENQYSKGSKGKWKWGPLNCKYVALCEGDDYWIDPLKLQKQVDFLESHPDYTMVCNRTKLYSEKKKALIGENYCYKKDRTIKTRDVISRSGLFISTCSIVYRKEIKDNYPDYCLKCTVGDYPLQIMAAMKGKIYYFNEAMSVYRIQNSDSWMGKQVWHSADEKNIKRIDSMINMFRGFSNDYPQYKRYFSNKIAHYLTVQSPSRFLNNGSDLKFFENHYKEEYRRFPLLWKFINKLKTTDIPGLRGYYSVYTKPYFDRFESRSLSYY